MHAPVGGTGKGNGMKDVILQMVAKADPRSLDEYGTILKEIIQRICLFGLWRAKFFEHAAFYGGTALRLLYGLDRFSEDLDFSLLAPRRDFSLGSYFGALRSELNGFGFEAEIVQKDKVQSGPVLMAFIKPNTRLHFLQVGIPQRLAAQVPGNQLLKVKFEVDIDPPPDFKTEIRYVLQPVPFSVRVFAPQDLFAGKMHALLCRRWGSRVKGRDWYDMVWFAGQQIPLNLDHLAARMRQTGDLDPKDLPLTKDAWRVRFNQVLQELDIDTAMQDVRPFLRESSQLELWSKDFFLAVADMIEAVKVSSED